MRLNINRVQAQETLHTLAVQNNVTDSQMAHWLCTQFYEPIMHRRISARIKAHSVAIVNLSEQL